jgi:hypothetical protein
MPSLVSKQFGPRLKGALVPAHAAWYGQNLVLGRYAPLVPVGNTDRD